MDCPATMRCASPWDSVQPGAMQMSPGLDSRPVKLSSLPTVMENVDDIDLWTGGLSEPRLPGTSLGPTFTAIFVDQFTRLRDGDRFYFENPNIYPAKFINGVLNTTLSDIIRRNTGIRRDELNPHSFFLPNQRPYQPDLRIGEKRNQLTHLGDDRYNRSAVGQRIEVRSSTRTWATSFASLENDGPYLSAIKVTAREPSKRKYLTRYLELGAEGRRNVTTDLVLGRYGWYLAPQETVISKGAGQAAETGQAFPDQGKLGFAGEKSRGR